MIFAWTFGVYMFSRITLVAIAAVLGGFAFGICRSLHYDVHNYLATHRSLLLVFWTVIRCLYISLGGVAFLLASRGRLPGTKM